ncbi:hypothetical protein ACFPRL_19715 [Pseudoclavibacter helvolus]
MRAGWRRPRVRWTSLPGSSALCPRRRRRRARTCRRRAQQPSRRGSALT